MHVFYQPELQNGINELEQEEARHAVKVLRLSIGDRIQVADGKGTMALATITDLSKRGCSFEVENRQTEPEPELPKVAIAPTKSIDRFEWFLEKSVEIGIGEIYPILCSNSERRTLKLDRCEKILLAAMKQSQRNWLPKLHDLTPFDKFIPETEGEVLIAHCREGNKTALNPGLPRSPWILIGPEGDFTLEEIQLAIKGGAKEIDLGKSRLRTETAGIFALSVMNFLKG